MKNLIMIIIVQENGSSKGPLFSLYSVAGSSVVISGSYNLAPQSRDSYTNLHHIMNWLIKVDLQTLNC